MNKAVIISCIFASTLFFSACGNSNISQDKKTEVKTTTQISTSVITTTSSSKSVTNSKINSTTQLTATENNFSDSDIQNALNVANSYYKTTTQKVKKLYFDKIDGKKIIFKGRDTKSNAYRRIILKQKNNNWVVVNEGY